MNKYEKEWNNYYWKLMQENNKEGEYKFLSSNPNFVLDISYL